VTTKTTEGPRKQKIKRTLKYEFTEAETREMSHDLARSIQESKSVEDALQSVKADFKSKLEALSATINQLSTLINNGYEHRLIDCVVEFNVPKDGMKRVIRLDTSEAVDERPMEPEEMQEPLL